MGVGQAAADGRPATSLVYGTEEAAEVAAKTCPASLRATARIPPSLTTVQLSPPVCPCRRSKESVLGTILNKALGINLPVCKLRPVR